MIYVICGPTGSGKTEASIKLSSFLNAPIVNADAFQIYKDMDIGTAKISKSHPSYTKHHLLDIVTPEETFSVKQYQDAFRNTIEMLKKDYRNIIVVGGTGLYIKASLFDFLFNEESVEIRDDFLDKTNEELWEMLKALDPKSLASLHPNNRKRVIRAIQIAKHQKVNKSTNIAMQSHQIFYPDVEIFFINPPRDELYSKINSRVDEMFEKGLVSEVKNLLIKYKLSLTASQAIGYKEVIDFIDNKISLEDAKELIKKRTRNYAKRQVTYFKHQFDSRQFANVQELINEVMKYEQ
ncbi:MAG: tRNA (adenosine(37)-N6)-dimethylallyltransferase MiaA [Erysipelotrichaceae bacterium]|nr:tRNA (adenosine(37)-N6)-dimethylallyltransferase MiaA [Bacilli bacterium]NLV28998.1 tRNA (adenosine(37)-N6)-dimethylallyltransferase MiaA [Erysipelotrichaceae bacterium]